MEKTSSCYLDEFLSEQGSACSAALQTYFVPRGLTNLGRTCAVNAVVQSLIACRPVAAFLLSGLHQACIRPGVDTSVLDELILLIKQMRSPPADNMPVRSKRFITSLLNAAKTSGNRHGAVTLATALRAGAALDAAEVLRTLVFDFLTPCMGPVRFNSCNSKNEAGELLHPLQTRAQDAFLESFTGEFSPLVQLTCGQTHISLQYSSDCGHETHTTDLFDTFFVFPVPVPISSSALQDCIAALFEPEQIAGYKPDPETDAERIAVRFQNPCRFPEVLILQLSRFSSENVKNEAFVALPEHGMRFGSSTEYNLRAVIHHLGNSVDDGHYISDTYCARRKQWIRHDDATVGSVSFSHVNSKTAYLLFFVRDRTL